MSCWIDVHGSHTKPFVITARDVKGRLVGLLPLYVAEGRLAGVVRYTILRYVGSYATGHEYPDWIVRRECERWALDAVAGALADSTGEWDCLWLPSIAGWTGALERMRDACLRAGFRCQVRTHDFAMTPLPETIDEFLKSLSPQRRKDMRSRSKKLLGREGVRVEGCERTEDVDRLLNALFRLHHQRRKLLGDPGTFVRRPAEAEFYRRFAHVAWDRGWLRLNGLTDGGECKAVQIGYAYGGVLNAMQEGFDPSYERGVGNILRLKVIEQCIAEGLREFDFLGEMTEHKRLWRANLRIGYDLFVGHASLKNRLMFTRQVWPTGRYFNWL